MSLLREIQKAAVDARDVAIALRKARILASRLSNERFKCWVNHELNGYPEDRKVIPDYRIISAIAKGYFSGGFGHSLNNAPIPAGCLPEGLHDFAQRVFMRQGVASIAMIVDGGARGGFKAQWPPDLVASVGMRIYEGMSCLNAWQEIPGSALVSVVDAVRNKLLDFVLEIEQENRDAGEVEDYQQRVPTERVNQIFNQVFNISGGSNNVAGGGHDFTQSISFGVREGDFPSLKKYLESIGISVADIAELRQAIAEEPSITGSSLGRKVSSWIRTMISKAASGVWQVGSAAAPSLLEKAISSYYGLG